MAVIGGGNVAIDAARTLIRLGCHEVHLVYRRTRGEMPANVEEVKQAEEEGLQITFLTVPVEALGSDGKVTGLKCLRAKLAEPDDKGRRKPVRVAGSDHVIGVDAIITAIGQRIKREGLDSIGSLHWTGTLMADTITSSTSVEGFFSGGDLVLGPATVVEAIGAGKRAAEGIDRFLRRLPQPKMPPVPVRRMRVALFETPASSKMTFRRAEMPFLGPERRRITFQQVELGYDENTAKQEARRCLRCEICKRCGKCVTICRDKMGIDALQFGYIDSGTPGFTDYRVTAERCILCGACAANCPTGAMKNLVTMAPQSKRLLALAKEWGIDVGPPPDGCIRCRLCIRVCKEVVGAGALKVEERVTERHPDVKEHHLYCSTCAKLFSDRTKSFARLRKQ